MYDISCFGGIKSIFHSWNKSILVRVHSPFYLLLSLVCELFVRIFVFCVHKEYWSVVSFAWLWYCVILPHKTYFLRVCVALVLFLFLTQFKFISKAIWP